MNHEFSNEEHGNRSHHKGLRSPKRITITVPYAAYLNLLERSDLEGRSLSNLSAFLLEFALGGQDDRSGRTV